MKRSLSPSASSSSDIDDDYVAETEKGNERKQRHTTTKIAKRIRVTHPVDDILKTRVKSFIVPLLHSTTIQFQNGYDVQGMMETILSDWINGKERNFELREHAELFLRYDQMELAKFFWKHCPCFPVIDHGGVEPNTRLTYFITSAINGLKESKSSNMFYLEYNMDCLLKHTPQALRIYILQQITIHFQLKQPLPAIIREWQDCIQSVDSELFFVTLPVRLHFLFQCISTISTQPAITQYLSKCLCDGLMMYPSGCKMIRSRKGLDAKLGLFFDNFLPGSNLLLPGDECNGNSCHSMVQATLDDFMKMDLLRLNFVLDDLVLLDPETMKAHMACGKLLHHIYPETYDVTSGNTIQTTLLTLMKEYMICLRHTLDDQVYICEDYNNNNNNDKVDVLHEKRGLFSLEDSIKTKGQTVIGLTRLWNKLYRQLTRQFNDSKFIPTEILDNVDGDSIDRFHQLCLEVMSKYLSKLNSIRALTKSLNQYNEDEPESEDDNDKDTTLLFYPLYPRVLFQIISLWTTIWYSVSESRERVMKKGGHSNFTRVATFIQTLYKENSKLFIFWWHLRQEEWAVKFHDHKEDNCICNPSGQFDGFIKSPLVRLLPHKDISIDFWNLLRREHGSWTHGLERKLFSMWETLINPYEYVMGNFDGDLVHGDGYDEELLSQNDLLIPKTGCLVHAISYMSGREKTIDCLLRSKFTIIGDTSVSGIGVAKSWMTRLADELFHVDTGVWQMTKSGLWIAKPESTFVMTDNDISYVDFISLTGSLIVWFTTIGIKFPYPIAPYYLDPRPMDRLVWHFEQIDEQLASSMESILQATKNEQLYAMDVELSIYIDNNNNNNNNNNDVGDTTTEVLSLQNRDYFLQQQLDDKYGITSVKAFQKGIHSTFDFNINKMIYWDNMMHVLLSISKDSYTPLQDFLFGPIKFPRVTMRHDCTYSPATFELSQSVTWFWNYVDSISDDRLEKLLKFISGSSKYSDTISIKESKINTNSGDSGSGGNPNTISNTNNNESDDDEDENEDNDNHEEYVKGVNTNDLPKASTCFNVLTLLSKYESYKIFCEKLDMAIDYSDLNQLTER